MNSATQTGQHLVKVCLGDVSEITMGQSPDSVNLNTSENGLPFLQGCAEFGRKSPQTTVYCNPPLRTSKPESILISVRAPVGTLNWGEQSYCIGRGLAAIRAINEVADTGFLLYAISENVNYLHRRSQGSTFLAVGGEDLKSFPVPSFRIEAQHKIARILGTIDQAIEKTQVLIDKYQQIKAGLMHDLFIRGIGSDGQLRPPREQAPELYQETPIGWIPKEWLVKSCSSLCSRICVGIVIQPTQYYVEDGVPALRSANVREVGVDPSNLVYISPASNKLLAKSQIRGGDIVTVRTGYPGTSAVVPQEFDGSNCIDILISTPTSQIDSEYLCSWINSSFGKGQVLRQQGGMAQQHFNVAEMRELLVAVPDIAEQLKISERLGVCSNMLLTEHEKLGKLKTQKSGLMHDLLTGKVPVKIEQEAQREPDYGESYSYG